MKRRSAWWVVWLVCFKEFLICRVSIFLGQFLYAAQSNQSYSTLIDCYNRLNSRYLGLCLSNVLCEIGCMEIADVRDGDVNTRKFGDDIFFKSLLSHFQQKHFVETVSWWWHFFEIFLNFQKYLRVSATTFVLSRFSKRSSGNIDFVESTPWILSSALVFPTDACLRLIRSYGLAIAPRLIRRRDCQLHSI